MLSFLAVARVAVVGKRLLEVETSLIEKHQKLIAIKVPTRSRYTNEIQVSYNIKCLQAFEFKVFILELTEFLVNFVLIDFSGLLLHGLC